MNLRLAAFVLLLQSLVFESCLNKPIYSNEIVGTWSSGDGSKITFWEDSSFRCENMLAYPFFIEGKYRGRRFDGFGKWMIKKGDNYWEVQLMFATTSIGFENYQAPLYLRRGKDRLEIFLWSDEPGSGRVSFVKEPGGNLR